MMSIYAVEITTVAVVEADSQQDAERVARDNLRDAMSDSEPDIFVRQEVKSLRDLGDGWDGECLPYGGDGDKRLKDLLPPNDEEIKRFLQCERRLAAVTRWLEMNQPDVFRRGLWDAVNEA